MLQRKRKYSNDYCKMVAKKVQRTSIKQVAEHLKKKYHDVQYINAEFYRRQRLGEYDDTIQTDDYPTGRVYLKPRVVGYKDIGTAWGVINATFNDDQLDIIHKFYNTVLFESKGLSNVDVNNVSYEQV